MLQLIVVAKKLKTFDQKKVSCFHWKQVFCFACKKRQECWISSRAAKKGKDIVLTRKKSLGKKKENFRFEVFRKNKILYVQTSMAIVSKNVSIIRARLLIPFQKKDTNFPKENKTVRFQGVNCFVSTCAHIWAFLSFMKHFKVAQTVATTVWSKTKRKKSFATTDDYMRQFVWYLLLKLQPTNFISYYLIYS